VGPHSELCKNSSLVISKDENVERKIKTKILFEVGAELKIK
jgi:hypothetical protein